MQEPEHNQSVEIAMQVILFAGNARDLILKALSEANIENFEKAKELLEKAEEEARSAHRYQTDFIQSEARGEDINISILLIHAQDTLMVALSEINVAKQLIKIYEKMASIK